MYNFRGVAISMWWILKYVQWIILRFPDFTTFSDPWHLSVEYIVAFKGYYRQEARERFIEAALNESNVVRWEVVPRNNPASDYPSDFDVVQVSCILVSVKFACLHTHMGQLKPSVALILYLVNR